MNELNTTIQHLLVQLQQHLLVQLQQHLLVQPQKHLLVQLHQQLLVQLQYHQHQRQLYNSLTIEVLNFLFVKATILQVYQEVNLS